MKQILVIDDDADVRNMLGRILDHEGYSIKEALNGTEAIKLIDRQKFDLIITDIIMPKK